MTLVGPDEFGRFVRRRLTDEGVDTAALGTHRTARTGVTFVAIGPSGERSFLFYRGTGRTPSADQLIDAVDVDAGAIARARVFQLGSSTLAREPARAATLRALELAERAGCLVSIDPNWRPHLWDDPSEAAPLLKQVVARADLVKISDDELGPLAGTSDAAAGARALRALGAKLVVVTLGARGCYFDGAAGQGALAGERVKVVDTTGAGDGFVAGMLASLGPRFAAGATVADLALDEVRAACALGNRVGARAVMVMGATAGLPRRSEL
jgi:fructokinase